MRRLIALLRSRRLAVVLLLALMAFSVLGTLLPQGDATDPDVASWDAARPGLAGLVAALGLHDVYGHPLFIAAALLLAVSTIACSWERTRAAVSAWTRSTTMPASMPGRLAERPMRTVEPTEGLDTAAALRPLGLRTEAERDGVLHLIGPRWGLLGSPLFHWSLAALIVVVGLGQLTRSEGMIGVPVGADVPLTAASFGTLHRGPLYAEPKGLTISARDLVRDFHSADGVARGEAAIVTISRDGAPLASGRVYPNSPLHLGSIVVHQAAVGLAAVIHVRSVTGAELGVARPLVDFADVRPDGAAVGGFDIRSPEIGDAPLLVSVALPLDPARGGGYLQRRPAAPSARLTVTRGGAVIATGTVTPGASVTLPGLGSLQLADVVYYTRLTVVDDWSVYAIYALFATATLGLALAVLAPYREVWLLAVPDGSRVRYHVAARHAKSDPGFLDRASDALRRSPDTGEAR